MDVYLVPVGTDRHELYFEVEYDETVVPDADTTTSGFFKRYADRFRAVLAEAERERLLRERGIDSGKSGLWRRVMRKVAEVVAEQRLLWHLRNEQTARLRHPDDLDAAAALAIARGHFASDFKKHRRWAVIDTVLAIILGPLLFFVPGPNVVGWYFFFRGVGHYLSMRGAQQGLDRVTWETALTPELTRIRGALTLPRGERRAELDRIAHALGLNHLAAFVERVAAQPS
jgi:hypothetical protein